MVKIQNTAAIDAIRNGAKLSISEGFPTELGMNVVPVMDMTPRFHRFVNVVRQADRSTTGTTTVYTVPTEGDFYLVAINFNAQYDATADSNSTSMNITMDGVAVPLVRFKKLTTTATQHEMSHVFSIPLKLDKGSVISIGMSYTVGNGTCCATILGYLVT